MDNFITSKCNQQRYFVRHCLKVSFFKWHVVVGRSRDFVRVGGLLLQLLLYTNCKRLTNCLFHYKVVLPGMRKIAFLILILNQTRNYCWEQSLQYKIKFKSYFTKFNQCIRLSSLYKTLYMWANKFCKM